jgi:hypothetical protein
VTARSSSGGKRFANCAPPPRQSATKAGLQPYRYALFFMTDEVLCIFFLTEGFYIVDEDSNGSLAKQCASTDIS